MPAKGCNYSGPNKDIVCRKCGEIHINPFLGKHHTEKYKKYMSELMTGKKKSKEHVRKIREVARNRTYDSDYMREIGKKSSGMKGKHHSEEGKAKMRKANSGLNSGMYGKTPPKICGYGKQGRRPDLNNQFFRSTWEANFARFLNLLNTEWVFEYKERRCYFPAEGRTYVPDFYLPEYNLDIEITGYIRPYKTRKIKLFNKYYPERTLIHIAPNIWEKYFLPYKYLIPEWED